MRTSLLMWFNAGSGDAICCTRGDWNGAVTRKIELFTPDRQNLYEYLCDEMHEE